MCIHDSIISLKKRLSIKQYCPKAGDKFGIKLFVLYDVTSGIIVNFRVHCGAQTAITDTASLGVDGAVVISLLQDFLGSHRHLYIDDWCTSPKLLKYLYEHKIYACGRVTPHRAEMPVMNKKLKQGEFIFKTCPPFTAIKWHYKKDVHMLTTIHDAKIGNLLKKDRFTGPSVMKPIAVLDYLKNMDGVNPTGPRLSSLKASRR